MTTTLITCATSGMGSAIAQSLDDELILTGRNVDKLSQLCQSLPNKANAIELDFFSEHSVGKAAKQISQLNQIDRVVFIIPRIPPSSSLFPDNQTWQELYNHYFIRPLGLLKYLVEQERLNRGAKLVFLSGLSSKSALENYSTNNCLRSAWLGQAKTLALGLGELGISVNTLSLGGVMTESYTDKLRAKALANHVDFDQQMSREVSNVPLKKYASVQDVVDAVHGLLGPLTNHMTGQNILLDGGFFRGY
ncbi:SDR family oxidoreductase [Vibrio sp. JPW-9-11-11]|uniref:SDR family oxidoreductase n=1 Tax=Vibrio sp. JPW-9-11-11 TaxID=1416532 RepID=UPI001593CB40|nr:SDR family oxidoreductase [Vibrio sp. JPW-9-11-11]NVD07157.1 SDR family oxidoreductase [Vibrio sp. JPW-9-11-11]